MDKMPEASATQAHLISCQATDKIRVIDGLPTSISGSEQTVQALAAEFVKLAQDHKNIQASVVATQDKDDISHNDPQTEDK